MYQDGSVHIHAQWPHGLTCCLLLAETAPEAVARALQGPVQEALQHGQDEDRARTCAAAEALSGLLASRTAFEVLPGELMHQAITSARFMNLSSLSHSIVTHNIAGALINHDLPKQALMLQVLRNICT